MGIRNKEFLARHQSVGDFYGKLKAVKDEFIDTERSEALGIVYSGMDLFTPTSFFSPIPRKESIVTDAGVEEDCFFLHSEDDFSLGLRSGKFHRSIYKTGRFEALVEAYLNYAESQDEKFAPLSHNIKHGGPERGQLAFFTFHGPPASVVTATGFTESPHRILVMESGNNVEKNDGITVSELGILVSWMYGSMSAQKSALCRDGVRASQDHMIFPVIAISFLMPSHARVIQCYFDEGKLNIQSTPLYNFDVDRAEYSRLMDDFLKWIEPIPMGNIVLAERFREPTVATTEGDEAPTPKSSATGSVETAPSFGPSSLGLAIRSGNTGWQRSSEPTTQQASRSSPSERG